MHWELGQKVIDKIRKKKTKKFQGNILCRTDCLGNFSIDKINFEKYTIINHQKNRIDYCLEVNENADKKINFNEVMEYVPDDSKHLEYVMAQQLSDIFGYKKVKAIIMDSFSELVDQLFVNRDNQSQFCTCYRNISHSDEFNKKYECKNLLDISKLGYYYKKFFEKIIQTYGQIPIIFINFPTKFDNREKFKTRYNAIFREVEKLTKEFPNLFNITLDYVEHNESNPAFYHFSNLTYLKLSKELVTILQDNNINVKNKEFHKYQLIDEKPAKASDYVVIKNDFVKENKLTIVMQGPINYENDFTLETIKIYKKTFRNCPIILSTWNNENETILKEIEDLGCIVIRNTPPEIKCYCNANYQIKATQTGLKKAKEINSQYVIKTRTDQRLYETAINEYLFNLLKIFPLEDSITKQKQRLVTLSLNTFKYRLYDISDMFLFGHIDDVINFWSMDYNSRITFPEWSNFVEYSKLEPGEIGFTIQYLRKIGENLDFTLKNSWEMYKKYFCVIDANSVGLYWPKYTNKVFRWRNFYGENAFLEELTFKEWFNLYSNLENIITNEDIVKTNINKK